MSNLDERDLKFIEQEEKYYEQLIDDMLEEDNLDRLIAERLEYIDDSFDFEPTPAFEHLEELYSSDYDEIFENESRGIEDEDDYIDFIDYPEGPNENLSGAYYGEAYTDEFPDEFYDQFIEEAFANEDEVFENWIKEQIDVEELFIDRMLEDIISEEEYVKKAIDELIFEEIDLDYAEELFEYEQKELLSRQERSRKETRYTQNSLS